MRTLTLAASAACALALAAATTAPAARTAWTAYLAPTGTCPGAETTTAPLAEQRRALVCLVNWARRRAGLAPVVASRILSRAAVAKGMDVVRCDDFSHTPCGMPPTAAVRGVGYRFNGWGENLFYGSDTLGSPRTAMHAWLLSPPHRRTLFARGFEHAGVAVLRPAVLEGAGGVSLWVLELARPA